MAGNDARDALLDAVLPLPVDRAGFWPRFDAVAPWTLRVGLRLAAIVLARGWLVGRWTRLKQLPDTLRDRCITRAASWPLLAELVLVAKVVATLAAFEDPAHEARFRTAAPR